ncbi:Hypothetical protein PEIBARAKI_5321 [Petrimonas sp. IBARAKI]|jgi:hypothetical protein|nr:Hypothetical protein PEIBARAKI_5321 [Petrimonas sp. IBARAKI]
MTTEELKTKAVRLKGEIEALNSLVEKHQHASLKVKIQAIKAYESENPGAKLSYSVTHTNTPRGSKPFPVISQQGGDFVKEFEVMEQLLSEFAELCDEINQIQ